MTDQDVGPTDAVAGEAGRAAPETSDAGLGRNAAVMAAGTLLSRITGFGRVFALAYALGAGDLAGTYIVANLTPNIVYELVLGGVLSGTLLAVFVDRLTTDDEDDAWRAVSAVVTLAVVALAVVTLLFVAVAPLVIRLYTLRTAEGLADDQLAVATDLLRLFAPQVFFYGTVSISTALLNARRRFARPMFAPVLNNVIVIAVLLAYPTVVAGPGLGDLRGSTAGLLLLGLGTTAGVVANAVGQVPLGLLRRHIRPVWAPRHPAVRAVLRLSGWTAGFVVANQVALFVVYFLANADPSDAAVYNIAFTIFQLPHGVAAVSITTALAPELAARWSRGDAAGYRAQLGLGLRTVLATTVPAAAGYLLLARPLVSALLEYGALQASSADAIADTLRAMAIGLPAFSGWLFLTRAYQALHDTRTLFLLYLVENGINVVAALLLYPVLGVEGLALAFALAYWGGLAAGLWDLRRRVGGITGRHVAAASGRILVATVAMATVVAAVSALVGSEEGTGALLRAGAATVAGVSVYLVVARLVGITEIEALLRVRRRQS